MRIGNIAPGGSIGLAVSRGIPARELRLREILQHGLPRPGLSRAVFLWRLRNLPNLWRGAWRILWARALGLPHVYGTISLAIRRRDGAVLRLGVASMRVVTTGGAGFIVDAFQNLVELELMKYHGFGTGTTNEAVGDTTLVTELTTQYASDNIRPTGSQTEASATVYRTVGTLAPDADVAITEHGIFSQAATGGGVLLDRSKFAAVNLVAASGDSLVATYDLTIAAGG